MKVFLVVVASLILSIKCLAIGTVYVTLSYKIDGVAYQDVLVLGVGGKQTPDHDNTSQAYYNVVGTFDWSFDSTSGYDFRFGIERGYMTYRIGRQAGMAAFQFTPIEGGYNKRMLFGETYQLDVSSDLALANRMTDVFVHASELGGKKITNMTGGDIIVGLGGGGVFSTVPNNSAKVFPDVVLRFSPSNYNSSWEAHSEQDWATMFTNIEYMSGSYSLAQDFPYFANIVFYKASAKPTIHSPVGVLVYGDMVSTNADKVLYGKAGMPLRSAVVNVTTNFELMTWWDFTQSEWGSPKAKINEEVVCSSHATSHIISHTVNGNNIQVNELTGKGYIYFTMSQEPQSGYAGGSCTMRCWDASMGSDTSAYANTPADHKAESSAGTGVARFKVTVNIYAGTWKVEAL